MANNYRMLVGLSKKDQQATLIRFVTSPPHPMHECEVLWYACLCVCLFICLSISQLTYRTTRVQISPIFPYRCYLWPWLGPPLTAVRYVMYFRFCGWHRGDWMGQNQRRRVCFIQCAGWLHRGRSLSCPTASCYVLVVQVAVLQIHNKSNVEQQIRKSSSQNESYNKL